MIADTWAMVGVIKLIFFAYLLFGDRPTFDRTTIRIGTELLYFATTLAQSLMRILWAVNGPPATSRRRTLRATIGVIYPLAVNLAAILNFLEKVLRGCPDADPMALRAFTCAKILSLSTTYILFGLVLANRITELWDDSLLNITMESWEIIEVILWSSIAVWSLAPINGAMAALRLHMSAAPLVKEELDDFMDWTMNMRQTVGFIYYVRMAFMQAAEHEFVLRGDAGPEFDE
jgi:hypothetical protein